MSDLLVHVTRGSIVESRHRGDIAVVNGEGELLWSLGDPDRVTYARSAAKPMQALPLVESGAADAFDMTDEEIALCCASHSGEEMHVERVSALLARLGFTETDLQCGVHAPYRSQAYEQLLQTGSPVTAIHNNCSGKHAGMLAMAKFLGADPAGYLDLNHPVQQQILAVVSELCEVPVGDIAIGVDGCGVPVFGVPLARLAMAYARFTRPVGVSSQRAEAMSRIAQAMMRYPELVAGTDRFCTTLMGSHPGHLLGKTGAEGVYCAGLVDYGIGLCVKVDDGNSRASEPSVVETLLQTGLVPANVLERLQAVHHPVTRNHQGTVVGRLEPVFQLVKSSDARNVFQ